MASELCTRRAPAEQTGGVTSVVKTPESLASDIGRMQRESNMVMATVSSLADDELIKPSKCAGWSRAWPGRAATRSLSLGLCFIVHEPNG